jgi:hypothetical protein
MSSASAAEQYREYVGLEEPEHVDGISEDDEDDEEPAAKKSTAKKTSAKK